MCYEIDMHLKLGNAEFSLPHGQNMLGRPEEHFRTVAYSLEASSEAKCAELI